MRLLFLLLLAFSTAARAQHPLAFVTNADLPQLRASWNGTALTRQSFADLKKMVDPYLSRDVDVPVPKDPAGGYTHDRHKENYILLFNAGLLYQLTLDKRYADFARNIFLKYAALNPTLRNHPQATSSSPGRLFWQALNDANWLVYAGLGYDLIYPALSAADRQKIESGAFRPEVEFITGDLATWFNLLHNHGVWACAGVGIVGIATNNPTYLKMALYGTDGKGNGGFLAQLDHLFSPDGYYTEGPYYVRYALLPFYLFAGSLSHARPDLKIFSYRSQILKKALESALQLTNTDGTFLPFNDALKEKDYTTNEMVTALDIAWEAYGQSPGWLAVARRQGKVVLNRGGLALAKTLATSSETVFPYRTAEYTDGDDGKQGGISLLRSGSGKTLTTLGFKYATHGLSHGHYDQLGLFLFDGGREILSDYGSVRFINIEQKWGGRYLPENKSYAAQTVAHNTVVVDEGSQFGGREEAAEKNPGEKLFSDLSRHGVQVVSARQRNAYPGVVLERTVFLLNLPGLAKPLTVDLFRVNADAAHRYDLPFPYNGQLISTSFAYKPAVSTLQALGSRNGYQFLWKEAEAKVRDTLAQLTFLNDRTFYTVSSLVTDSAQLFLARTGANDPQFNLRREPSLIIRKQGRDCLFFNVIEAHGSFDPVTEFAVSSYSSVSGMQVVASDNAQTVVRLLVKGKSLLIGLAHTDAAGKHTVQLGGSNISWSGPFTVVYDGKTL